MTALLLDLTVKATVLFGAAALVVRILRHHSAASRHAVWLGFFCGVAMLPLAATVLPPVGIPVLSVPVATRGRIAPQRLVPTLTPPQIGSGSPAEAPVAVTSTASPTRSALPAGALVTAMWLAGAGLLGARMVVGAVGVWRLRRRACPVVAADVLGQVDAARRQLGVRRQVTVLSLDDSLMPLTWGVWRPVLLLPAAVVSTGRPDGLTAVILHEMAHVARLDAVAQLLGQLVTSALWFHPLTWVALRMARIECERACDDVALRHGARPTDYAMELLMLVRALRPMNAFVVGVLGAVRRSQLDRRIRRILSPAVSRRSASVASVVTAATLLAGAAPLAAARLTTRQTPPPPFVGVTVRPNAAIHAPTSPPTPVEVPTHPCRFAMAPVAELPPQTVVAQETVDAQIPWHAERAGMYQQVLDIAQRLIESCRMQIQIGTMAQIDVSDVEGTIARIGSLVRQDAGSSADTPDSSVRAGVRARFAAALHILEIDQTKFSVGLLRLTQFDADLLNAASAIAVRPPSGMPGDQGPVDTDRLVVPINQTTVVIVPFEVTRISVSDPDLARVVVLSPHELQIDGRAAGTASVSVWGDTPQISRHYRVDVESDAMQVFLLQIQTALANGTDASRADALLALARSTAFTPTMVEAYVNAVSRLGASERDRVLAQPIRVKPSGG